MVVKIQPAAKSISNAVEYNERKMDGKEGILDDEQVNEYLGESTGHVLATVNVPEISTLENEFQRLRMKNMRNTRGRKMENPAFHMSINPGELDMPMDENRIVEFTGELMARLGYGDNPYRIYRHDDTGRTHYHVVSTRIGQDGKKIKDSFENTRCESICKELAVKYGYILGLQENLPAETIAPDNTPETAHEGPQESRTSENGVQPRHETERPETGRKTPEKQQNRKPFVPPFKINSDKKTSEQYADIHKEAVTWNFTTPEQYGFLLRWRFNTEAKAYDDEIYFIGLDDKGNGCTPPIKSTDIGLHAMRDILKKCSVTDMKQKRHQRERLEKLVSLAAEQSETWLSFRKLMEEKGVYLVVSWTEDDKPFGVTWIDRGTKCIWKGSETATGLPWLIQLCQDKGWEMKRHWKYEKKLKLPKQSEQKNKNTQEPSEHAVNHASGSLSSISTKQVLHDLMNIHGVRPSQRSNADASKNGRKLKYGEEDNPNDIII